MALDKVSLAAVLESEHDRVKFVDSCVLGHEMGDHILNSFECQSIGRIPVPIPLEMINTLITCAKPFESDEVDLADRWRLESDSIVSFEPRDFPTQSIPDLMSSMLNQLGLDSHNVGAHLHQICIYRRGGKISKPTRETSGGTVGQLILQIPVENGYEGGRIRFSNENWDFSGQKNCRFHAIIYGGQGHLEMEPLTSGWKLDLIFHLNWKRDKIPPEIPTFLHVLKDLREILTPWGTTQSRSPRLLAIPLKHKHSKQDLKFALLRGKDRLIAEALMSLEFLELHLTMLTKHEQRSPHHEFCCIHAHNEHFMDEVLEEEYETDRNWIASDDLPVTFNHLDIDMETELLSEVEDVFDPDTPPDEQVYNDYDYDDLVLDYWYRWPVLVIWPKSETINILLQNDLDAVFDVVERQAASESTKPMALETLRRMLTYCQLHPTRMWKISNYLQVAETSNSRPDRLLKNCIALNAREECRQVLKILATEVNVEQDGETLTYWNMYKTPRKFTIGLASKNMAERIAAVIEVFGWTCCAELVKQLLEVSKGKDQIARCAELVRSLLDRKCNEIGVDCGRQVVANLLSSDVFESLNYADRLICVNLILRLEEYSTSSNGGADCLVARLQSLDTDSLGDLIINLPQISGLLIKTNAACTKYYHNLLSHLLSRDLRLSVTLQVQIAQVFVNYLWFADEAVLFSLAEKLVSNRCDSMVEKIVNSDRVEERSTTSPIGKRALTILTNHRINQLEQMKEPHFTWEQPEAVFASSHPQVEVFLRSVHRSTTYVNFNGIAHARNFARKYFRSESVLQGYSATAEPGGIGKKAYCRIVKTRGLHQFQQQEYAKSRKELARLYELRDKLTAG